MHPALAALTAIEAAVFAGSYPKLCDWCDDNHVDLTDEMRRYIRELAAQAPPPPPPPPPKPHPRRTDTEELKQLVRQAENLSPMVKAVARLCLFQNASLTQAAAALGISRETVRVHLRRLRALAKLVNARRAAYEARERMYSLDQTDRSRGMR